MKKLNLKSFVAGMLVAILAMTMFLPGLAVQLSKQISATYKDIKITVDGKTIEPKDANGNPVEPFIADGSTYLPVRAVAEAVGYDVKWDGNTNTVILTKKSAILPETGYSRTNPAPVGTAQTMTITSGKDEYNITMKINNIISGDEAWRIIYEENMFNTKPPDGKMYIIANVEAKVNKVNSDKSVSFNNFDFTAFTSDNSEYKKESVLIPNKLSGQVYEGGTITGNVAFLVDKSDANPKIVYGLKYDGTGGMWFALK